MVLGFVLQQAAEGSFLEDMMVSCVWFPDERFWVGFFGGALDQWRLIFLVGFIDQQS